MTGDSRPKQYLQIITALGMSLSKFLKSGIVKGGRPVYYIQSDSIPFNRLTSHNIVITQILQIPTIFQIE